MMDFNAEWRVIPGWPEYSVSEDGHVVRVKGGQGARAGKYLTPWRNVQNQYLCVHLWRDNRAKSIPVHRLVAFAFHGNPPSTKHVVAHCDGSRDNNRAWNLRWATQKENITDTFRHGTHNRGQRNGKARLSEESVLSIFSMAEAGHTQKAISQHFGVSRQLIGDVLNGRRWSHVDSRTSATSKHGSSINFSDKEFGS